MRSADTARAHESEGGAPRPVRPAPELLPAEHPGGDIDWSRTISDLSGTKIARIAAAGTGSSLRGSSVSGRVASDEGASPRSCQDSVRPAAMTEGDALESSRTGDPDRRVDDSSNATLPDAAGTADGATNR
jgi:hypothetical protein